MDITEFYQTFFEEAEELLSDMEQQLLQIDPSDPDGEQLNAIFRAAHSIKGGAGTFGFTVLQETTHLFENLLDKARHRELTLDPTTIDIFLETKDMLSDQLNAYRQQTEPDSAAYERICNTLKALAEEKGHGGSAAASATTTDQPSMTGPAPGGAMVIRIAGVAADNATSLAEELALFGTVLEQQHAGEVLTVRLETATGEEDIRAVLCFVVDDDQITFENAAAASSDDSLEMTAEEWPVEEEPVHATPEAEKTPAVEPAGVEAPVEPAKAAAPAAKKPEQRVAASSENASLRVSIEKIDQIINLVGELVITQSMLEQGTSDFDPVTHGSLLSGMNQLQRNARDLQEAVMSIRMMPMDVVFNRFPRLVRDLAGKLGKQVELETVGKSTELDKGLIERIVDPLTHLVRNSLDHGIETPDRRLAAGKPASGKLTLSASHQGGNILIEISDDGAGLNRERILNKARENGLAVSDAMSDDDVWQLIFAPGFSTAEQVTDLSGRGVGMDVVKRNIAQMGGHVDILSRPGQGTTTRIVLPLTLAILDGMSVRVGEEVYILPLGAIKESMQVRPEDISTVTGNDRVLHVRGEYLPLVELYRVFDIPDAQQDVTKGIVMIVQSEGRSFALQVDQLIGQHQVVVKNLETNYRRVPGISAATILGDGSVALILDIPALSRTPQDREGSHTGHHRGAAALH
ncbi:chemotaxis protein CheA [Kushneria marisflavi]|uniref:Chemotaxis protein CheA n=1 Tax=Kushneria marisflavi TaxID=157779 RepID=A0A240UTN2_9GAMM|nr:chemotaxis protein CheA [Kushneria marisflavi]ART64838.1 chemotaxis protein CheA [Kushneria marisflavi]